VHYLSAHALIRPMQIVYCARSLISQADYVQLCTSQLIIMRIFTLLIAFLSFTYIKAGLIRTLFKPLIDLDSLDVDQPTMQRTFDQARNITTVQRKNIIRYSLLK